MLRGALVKHFAANVGNRLYLITEDDLENPDDSRIRVKIQWPNGRERSASAIALGARPRDIVALIVREAGSVTGTGLVAGLALAHSLSLTENVCFGPF